MRSTTAPVAVCCPFGAVKVGPEILLQLAEVEVLVVEAVADLVLAVAGDDVGGLRLKLPVVAAVAGLVEAQTAGDRRVA